MKKVFLALAVVTVALVACNNEEKKVEGTGNDSPKVEAPKPRLVTVADLRAAQDKTVKETVARTKRSSTGKKKSSTANKPERAAQSTSTNKKKTSSKKKTDSKKKEKKKPMTREEVKADAAKWKKRLGLSVGIAGGLGLWAASKSKAKKKEGWNPPYK